MRESIRVVKLRVSLLCFYLSIYLYLGTSSIYERNKSGKTKVLFTLFLSIYLYLGTSFIYERKHKSGKTKGLFTLFAPESIRAMGPTTEPLYVVVSLVLLLANLLYDFYYGLLFNRKLYPYYYFLPLNISYLVCWSVTKATVDIKKVLCFTLLIISPSFAFYDLKQHLLMYKSLFYNTFNLNNLT